MDFGPNYACRWWYVNLKSLIAKSTWAGVDFGSKLAGTTAISYLVDDQLKIDQITKGQDTDKWLVKTIKDNHWDYVFIDAPLSLPGAFFGSGDDYSYRKADRLIGAMSPMFLGGLTARAIKLKSELSNNGVNCIEVYPGGYIRSQPSLSKFYDKKNLSTLSKMTDELSINLQYEFCEKPTNYHQLDSSICWYIGNKYLNGNAQSLGDPEEGLIWI